MVKSQFIFSLGVAAALLALGSFLTTVSSIGLPFIGLGACIAALALMPLVSHWQAQQQPAYQAVKQTGLRPRDNCAAQRR